MAVPSAPTALSATRKGPTTVAVAFTQAAATPAVTNYKYSLNGGAYVALSPTDAASPIVLPLADSADYSITLKAVNTDGDSAASAAVALTTELTDMNSGKVHQPGGYAKGKTFAPPVRVPNIVGLSVVNGTAALTAVGLVVGTDTATAGTLNQVLTQNPATNALVAAGAAVNITHGNTP
jgi:hypothetical protein